MNTRVDRDSNNLGCLRDSVFRKFLPEPMNPCATALRCRTKQEVVTCHDWLKSLAWESKTILEEAFQHRGHYGEATLAWSQSCLSEAIASGMVL